MPNISEARARREALGLSQRAVAAEAQISQRAVVKVEHGLGTLPVVRQAVLDALHRLEGR